MKKLSILLIAALAAPLAGCSTLERWNPDPTAMNGFPIDEACAQFYSNEAMYHGNRASAYATNCAGGAGGEG